MTEPVSYCNFLAIFVVNLTDYESSGNGQDNTKCIGNGTLKDFTNCVEENTRDYVKCSKPCVRSNRIFKESVVPVIQPLDGSIGFNETSQMSLAINTDVNTSLGISLYDKTESGWLLNLANRAITGRKVAATSNTATWPLAS